MKIESLIPVSEDSISQKKFKNAIFFEFWPKFLSNTKKKVQICVEEIVIFDKKPHDGMSDTGIRLLYFEP